LSIIAVAAAAAAALVVDANSFIRIAHHRTNVRVGINCRRDGHYPHTPKKIPSDLHKSIGHAI